MTMNKTHYALLALVACAPEPEVPSSLQAIDNLSPVRFADVTEAAGLNFRMRSGNQIKNYILVGLAFYCGSHHRRVCVHRFARVICDANKICI